MKNRTGEEIQYQEMIFYHEYDCPICGASYQYNKKIDKQDYASWGTDRLCTACNSEFQIIYGDRMGGQADYLTITKDNYNVETDKPS